MKVAPERDRILPVAPHYLALYFPAGAPGQPTPEPPSLVPASISRNSPRPTLSPPGWAQDQPDVDRHFALAPIVYPSPVTDGPGGYRLPPRRRRLPVRAAEEHLTLRTQFPVFS